MAMCGWLAGCNVCRESKNMSCQRFVLKVFNVFSIGKVHQVSADSSFFVFLQPEQPLAEAGGGEGEGRCGMQPVRLVHVEEAASVLP